MQAVQRACQRGGPSLCDALADEGLQPKAFVFMPSRGRPAKAFMNLDGSHAGPQQQHAAGMSWPGGTPQEADGEPTEKIQVLVSVGEKDANEYAAVLPEDVILVMHKGHDNGIGFARNVLLQMGVSFKIKLPHFFMCDDNVFSIRLRKEGGGFEESCLLSFIDTVQQLPNLARCACTLDTLAYWVLSVRMRDKVQRQMQHSIGCAAYICLH